VSLLLKIDEALFSIGRRFPSIRLTSEAKKANKKKVHREDQSLYSQPDKSSKVNTDIGSCSRPVAAIYGTLTQTYGSKLDLNSSVDSNIYENGHIVLQQHKAEAPCCCPSPFSSICKRPQTTSNILCAVIVISVTTFLLAGSLLLYQSCMYMSPEVCNSLGNCAIACLLLIP
jgi:hypothetical protein